MNPSRKTHFVMPQEEALTSIKFVPVNCPAGQSGSLGAFIHSNRKGEERWRQKK